MHLLCVGLPLVVPHERLRWRTDCLIKKLQLLLKRLFETLVVRGADLRLESRLVSSKHRKEERAQLGGLELMEAEQDAQGVLPVKGLVHPRDLSVLKQRLQRCEESLVRAVVRAHEERVLLENAIVVEHEVVQHEDDLLAQAHGEFLVGRRVREEPAKPGSACVLLNEAALPLEVVRLDPGGEAAEEGILQGQRWLPLEAEDQVERTALGGELLNLSVVGHD